MFEPPKTKLTPIKGRDWEDELWLSKWMHRPMRKYLEDKPIYPWCVPEPKVNFDLVKGFNKGLH